MKIIRSFLLSLAFILAAFGQTSVTINSSTKQLMATVPNIVVGTGQSITTTGTGLIRATSFLGNLTISNFNGGTDASASTFWRGDGTWATVAGSGTVTIFSAGNLSPLFTANVATATTTPSLTFTLSNFSANTVYAGPTSGASAPPTVRALVAADIPTISLTSGVSGILPAANGGSGLANSVTLNYGPGGTLGTAAFTAATAYEVPITFSTGLTRVANTVTANAVNLAAAGSGGVTGNLPIANLNGGLNATNTRFWRGDGVWATPAGAGTVTSFSAGSADPLFTTLVTTASSTPALTFFVTSAAANSFWAGPSSGGDATPTYRPITVADVPLISLVSHVFGILPPANGGSGVANSVNLNFGPGGTLGTAAFTNTGSYEVPLTFSTGLTRTVNTVTVNTSQNIATLSNLTGNGLVTTSGGTGALSVSTTSLPAAIVGSSLTSVGTLTTLTVSGHTTFEGVTSTGATGTGNLVYSVSPTLTGSPVSNSLTSAAGQAQTFATGTFGTYMSAASATGGVTFNGAILGLGATGGMPAGAGAANFTGVSVNGVPVGTSTDTYWVVDGTGGIKYTTGVNSTPIGQATAAAGKFTTLSASSGISGTNSITAAASTDLTLNAGSGGQKVTLSGIGNNVSWNGSNFTPADAAVRELGTAALSWSKAYVNTISSKSGTALVLQSNASATALTLATTLDATFASTTSGTSTIAAAILGKSLGLTENEYIGGLLSVTGNITGAAIVGTTLQSGSATGQGGLTVTTTGENRVVLQSYADAAVDILFQSHTQTTGHYNWLAGANTLTNQAFEITPSTAINGTTFTTAAFRLAGATGDAVFTSTTASTSTTTGSATFGGGVGIAGGLYVGTSIRTTTVGDPTDSRYIVFNSAGKMTITGDAALLWATDNSYDIGAAGATRPRNGYFGGNGVFSGTTSAASSITGALLIGNGTAATNVGIGAGNIQAGAAITAGTSLNAAGLNITTGDPQIGTDTRANDINFYLDTAAGNNRYITWATAGVARWKMAANSTAESGANAGTRFVLSAYGDTGTLIDAPITIIRAAGGLMTLTRPVSFTDTTASTSTTTGSGVFGGGVGVAGNLWMGGALNIPGGTAAIGTITNQTGTLYLGGTGPNFYLDGIGTSNSAQIHFRSANGTQAARTDSANNDILGIFNAAAYSNGAYYTASQITFEVDGTFTTGQAPPSRFKVWTNAANASPTAKLTINSAGDSSFASVTAATSYTAASVTLAGGLGTAGAIISNAAHSAVNYTTTNSKVITDNSATGIFTVAVPSNGYSGGKVLSVIEATGGGDYQTHTTDVTWSVVNKGGVLTATIRDDLELSAVSAGTLTDTWTITTGTNNATITVKANSSLTTPTDAIKFVIINPVGNAITLL